VSGWELGLALLGVLVTGFGLGITAVWLYARHVFRSKLNALPGQLLDTTATGRPVAPPPPR
jgi:hypothetical protein